MATHTYNSSTPEAEAERWQVQGQPGLHNKTLSQKKKGSLTCAEFNLYLIGLRSGREGQPLHLKLLEVLSSRTQQATEAAGGQVRATWKRGECSLADFFSSSQIST
jgi:hypothetical protein